MKSRLRRLFAPGRRPPAGAPPYWGFPFPLNVLMHVLTLEEGSADCLHYGIFEDELEPISRAQERSTELLLDRLPPPPARLLEVGVGLGTTLARLARAGYDAEGITPDAAQLAMIRARHGDDVRVAQATFERFRPACSYDMVLFQESSQYIASEILFARARTMSARLLVLDEFTLAPADGPEGLHRLDRFLAAAARSGWRKTEEVDLSAEAAPTVGYFTKRLPAYRERLMADLGLEARSLDELVASGGKYIERYRHGEYGYRLLHFER